MLVRSLGMWMMNESYLIFDTGTMGLLVDCKAPQVAAVIETFDKFQFLGDLCQDHEIVLAVICRDDRAAVIAPE